MNNKNVRKSSSKIAKENRMQRMMDNPNSIDLTNDIYEGKNDKEGDKKINI